MKQLALFLLSLYQMVISPFLHALTGTSRACRYPVTCSAYAKEAIMKYGVLKGTWLAIKRVSICHPFARGGSLQV